MRLLHSWLRRHGPALALAALAACLGSAAPPPARADDAPVIAAAASLRYALEEMAARFKKDTGKSVRLTYGATALPRQAARAASASTGPSRRNQE